MFVQFFINSWFCFPCPGHSWNFPASTTSLHQKPTQFMNREYTIMYQDIKLYLLHTNTNLSNEKIVKNLNFHHQHQLTQPPIPQIIFYQTKCDKFINFHWKTGRVWNGKEVVVSTVWKNKTKSTQQFWRKSNCFSSWCDS